MIVLGDSWAAGWNCDNNSVVGGWPEILGPEEKNVAVPGSTAEQWSDGIFIIPHLANEDVVISIGGNDLIALMALPLQEQVFGSMRLMANLVAVHRIIESRFPKRIIFFEYANPTDKAIVGEYLSEFNAMLREIMSGNNIESIALRTQDFLRSEHFPKIQNGDFHPNLEGQRLIAEAIKERIVIK